MIVIYQNIGIFGCLFFRLIFYKIGSFLYEKNVGVENCVFFVLAFEKIKNKKYCLRFE